MVQSDTSNAHPTPDDSVDPTLKEKPNQKVSNDGWFMSKVKEFLAQGQFLDDEGRPAVPPTADELKAPWSWLPYNIWYAYVWNRPYLFAILFPLTLVWTFYFTYMFAAWKWHVFETGWPLSITMVFGSTVAGATSEGGGSIAFPVMTLVLGIKPKIARDFSLLIQSFGMTAAAFTIIYMRIIVEKKTLIYGNLGGATGVIIGLQFVAPHMPPAFTKIIFVSVWLSFAGALFLLNQIRSRHVHLQIPFFTLWKGALLFVFGCIGGILTSLSGSGIDICTFACLTLFFRVSEKTATPTSVVLMGCNTVVGALWRQFAQGGVEPDSLIYLWSCVPIVVIGAPMGSFLMSFCHRLVAALCVYITDTVQFILAYIVMRKVLTTPLIITSVVTVVTGSIIWATLTGLGHIMLQRHLAKIEDESQVTELADMSNKSNA